MTNPSSPSPRRGARTFRAGCAVLASVAAAQAAATVWPGKTAERAAAQRVVVAEIAAAEKPVVTDPFSKSFAGADDPHPEMRTVAGDPPPYDPAAALLKENEAQPVVTALKPPAPLDVPITDEDVLGNLEEGLHLRSQGDTLGAQSHLRAALAKLPDHPKLLYHMAQTLDMMGLSRKADPHWKSLYALGKGAGEFFTLAQERMADGPQLINEPEEKKEGKFTVVDLRDEKVPDIRNGERVRFTAILKKHTDEPVNADSNISLVTHFFDTVNGRRWIRSQVPQPVLTCTSLPLDWKEGTETFTFDYWQADMTPAEIVKYGRCRYYGCTLEVIYKDELQDVAATTPECLQLRELPVPDPEPQDSILDSTPAPVDGRQPESGLFPPMLKP